MSTMTPTASALSSVPSTDLPTLLLLARTHAETYMSQPHYDASHDWSHVQRVVALAKHILSAESAAAPSPSSSSFTPSTLAPESNSESEHKQAPTHSRTREYDPTLVELSALLHDVGDHKYAAPGSDPTTEVERTLLDFGASLPLARTVQEIVNCVSYTHEIAHPAKVAEVLAKHPELGIVQDADRLNAIGAVGIGRLFTYGGAKGGKGPKGGAKGRSMEATMGHMEEKLVKLEGLMKTREGRRLARERTRRLEEFRGWWVEETGMGAGYV